VELVAWFLLWLIVCSTRVLIHCHPPVFYCRIIISCVTSCVYRKCVKYDKDVVPSHAIAYRQAAITLAKHLQSSLAYQVYTDKKTVRHSHGYHNTTMNSATCNPTSHVCLATMSVSVTRGTKEFGASHFSPHVGAK